MGSLVEPRRSRAGLRVAVIALSAIGAAGCSGDVTRFSDNPFSNPFASRNSAAEATGSVPSAQAAPVARVEAQPLPQSNSTYGAALPPPPPRYGASSYAPQRPDSTGSIPPGAGNRSATRLASNAPVAPLGHPAPTPPASLTGGVHVVAPGETLSSVARLYGKSRTALAKANNIAPDTKIRIGQHLIIPGAKPAAPPRLANAAPASARERVIGHRGSAPGAEHVAANAPASPPPSAPPAAKTAAGTPTASARVTAPEPTGEQANGEAANETAGSAPSFRWPVHGRIIAAFGAKPNGQQNDGINIAVPEGTSIKASEDGVVAYAGNELKGYGNLILLRHRNGFVTAYAHASDISVKRGDQVKRGQVIARAGQTGNVGSPQLHFEIRKGATPVDPTQYLSGTGV